MNNCFKLSAILVSLLLVGMVFACSESADEGGSGSCNEGNTGYTDCNFGMEECQPGQYCNSDELACTVGCTSDVNCASNQSCNLTGGSPGTCENCVAQETTGGGGETGGGGTSESNLCEESVDKAITCGLLESAERAAAITECEADRGNEDLEAFLSCVETAGDDCDQIENCMGEGGGGGGGDMPGSCTEDDDCNDRPGLTHQICSGGVCMPGCRDDEDCGQDYICDDFSSQCMPDDFG